MHTTTGNETTAGSDISGGSTAPWWSHPPEEVLGRLGTDASTGLDPSEHRSRLERDGPNALRAVRRQSAWFILLRQFRSLVMAILAVAAAVAYSFGEWIDGSAVVVVIVVNALLGFFAELRAVRSMESLRRLARVRTRVRRGGEVRMVPAESLVAGDIVVLEAGDVVTADLRLLRTSQLEANESTLTGESVPVGKAVDAVAEDATLPERHSLVFKGTAITRGTAEGVVVATGMRTELGRIARLVEEAEEEVTPLEKRLEGLGRRLIGLTVVIAAVPAVIGVLRGKDLVLMVETGLALAVAAIPEGLPIVATIALGRGMLRLARRGAIVNRLSSVEALGATDVIFTDKTGTLTENRLTVERLVLADGPVDVAEGLSPAPGSPVEIALRIAVLCNEADLPADGDPSGATGDPLEVALLVAGARGGVAAEALHETHPRVHVHAFDASLRLMATVHDVDGEHWVAVKGAPEAVLDAAVAVRTAEGTRPLTEEDRERWLAGTREHASEGYRMLALAERTVDAPEDDPYADLTLVALVAFLDPPRAEVAEAIAECHRAGIRVVMVTGDQADTARTIARQLGIVPDDHVEVVEGRALRAALSGDGTADARLLDAPIYARIDPEQKLALVRHQQRAGHVTAMTGDGVNDAPALKKADIGVAMGKRGTEVAREAASMVLQDDSFGTIVAAVRQGRVIFANIRKFVFYLLSCNLSEVLIVSAALLFGTSLPLLPLQVLFLNLVTDVFPALALAFGEGGRGVMSAPPREPGEPILTRRHWVGVVVYGLLITAATMTAMIIARDRLGLGPRGAVTVSFLTLAFAQVWHVLSLRSSGSSRTRNDVTGNPWVWGAIVLCSGLLLLAVHVPLLAEVLRVERLPLSAWGLVLGLSLAPFLLGQLPVWAGWDGPVRGSRADS